MVITLEVDNTWKGPQGASGCGTENVPYLDSVGYTRVCLWTIMVSYK